MDSEKKVKKELTWHSLTIKLYKWSGVSLPPSSIGNISAFSAEGNLLWSAEPSRSYKDLYFDMYIDVDKGCLLGYTSNSYIAYIDLSTGKIFDFRMIK